MVVNLFFSYLAESLRNADPRIAAARIKWAYHRDCRHRLESDDLLRLLQVLDHDGGCWLEFRTAKSNVIQPRQAGRRDTAAWGLIAVATATGKRDRPWAVQVGLVDEDAAG